MSFATRFVKKRDLASITNEDIAKVLAIEPETVSRWERGDSRPNEALMERLAIVIKTSTTYLSTGIEMSPTLPKGAITAYSSGSAYMPVKKLPMRDAPRKVTKRCLRDSDVSLPQEVATSHPHAFIYNMPDASMERCFPKGAALLIDPDLEPLSGSQVLIKKEDGTKLVRTMYAPNNLCMFSPESFEDGYEDFFFEKKDMPLEIIGVVVYFQAKRDFIA